MSRLPSLRREDLSPEHHHAWDEIARTHRGNVNGPFSALIHVPPMGLRVSELEGYFRFEGRLSPADRELIVCAVTKYHGAAFPYAIHDDLAREAGTSEAARYAAASGKGSRHVRPCSSSWRGLSAASQPCRPICTNGRKQSWAKRCWSKR